METLGKFILLKAELKKAISEKNKKRILAVYDEVEALELNEISDLEFEEYDDMIDDANEILYDESL